MEGGGVSSRTSCLYIYDITELNNYSCSNQQPYVCTIVYYNERKVTSSLVPLASDSDDSAVDKTVDVRNTDM